MKAMADIAKILSEKLNLTEEAQNLIQEAWNQKLSEAKEEVAANLREEFAQKFNHDKEAIIESMDKLLQEQVEKYATDLAEDKKALAAQAVKYKTNIKEHAGKLDDFVNNTLIQELKEHATERNSLKKNQELLENFVLKQLSKEIEEFRNDKKSLSEQRVKLVTEGKQQLVQAKRTFVTEAAKLIESSLDKVLKSEISQYRDDIEKSRKNDFGRRIFEAYSAEYLTSYLNENSEVQKLVKIVNEKSSQIEEAAKIIQNQKTLNESLTGKLNASKDLLVRDRELAKLLAPLGREKRSVMKELLESVKTPDLEKVFNKYLPAVLDEKPTPTRTLTESTSVKTGDRAQAHSEDNAVTEIEQIKRLAGLK